MLFSRAETGRLSVRSGEVIWYFIEERCLSCPPYSFPLSLFSGITESTLLARSFAYNKRYLNFLHTSRFLDYPLFVMALIFLLLSFHSPFSKKFRNNKWKSQLWRVEVKFRRRSVHSPQTVSVAYTPELSKYGGILFLIRTYSNAVSLRKRNEFVICNGWVTVVSKFASRDAFRVLVHGLGLLAVLRLVWFP